MKLGSILGLSLGFSLGFAFAEDEMIYKGLYLASGLSEENGVITGWYDANKTDADDPDLQDEKPGPDDNMCYAASAANLIAWWQNSKYALSSSALNYSHEQIWDTFVRNNTDYDAGGDPLSAINWWISGVYAPVNSTDKNWAAKDDPVWSRHYASYEDVHSDEPMPVTLNNYQKDGAPFGGYYFEQYGLTQEDLSNFLVNVWCKEDSTTTHHTLTLGAIEMGEDEGPDSIYDIKFVKILEDSPISLAILSEGSDNEDGLCHAITLWGVEFDAEGNLTTMWLTDSDDYETDDPDPVIFSMSVEMSEKDNRIYLGKLDNNGQYVSDYGNNVYIGAIYALDTTTLASWQLVPEPATATLSLLALAGFAARRRRR